MPNPALQINSRWTEKKFINGFLNLRIRKAEKMLSLNSGRYSVFIKENCFFTELSCSKKREVVPDLAPMLWNSFGTIAALLQEIINIYPAINPATLTAHQSNRQVIVLFTFNAFNCFLLQSLQRLGSIAMCSLTPRDKISIFTSACPVILVPLFAYCFKN